MTKNIEFIINKHTYIMGYFNSSSGLQLKYLTTLMLFVLGLYMSDGT